MLNDEFFKEIQVPGATLNKVYERMVFNYPYRVLSKFTFEKKPGESQPIRSSRVAVPPPLTDVSNDNAGSKI